MFLPLLIIAIVIFVIGILLVFGEYGNQATLAFMIAFLLCIASFAIIIINPGEVGVTNIWGNVGDDPVPAGIHFIMPFITDIIVFDAKTQVDTQQASVLTSDALTITTDVSINYRIDPMKAPMIYKTMGIGYKDTVIDPTIRSVIRDSFAVYDTKTLYSSGRTNLSADIKQRLDTYLSIRGVIIEDVLLRQVEPPAAVKQSIEAKQQMEQEIQKKQFEVQKEVAEADRKRAEAQGIADANRIISDSLSNHYLQWYWLDKLSGKEVFYVPTGSNGFPINLVKSVDYNNSTS